MEKLKRFVCIDCGGELEVSSNGKFAKCKACGLTIKIEETLTSETLIDYKQATEYWKTYRFADAKRKFLDITKTNPTFAEAYWGAVVSEYGIEWGINRFGDVVPTCHRAHTKCVYDDENYIKAIEYVEDKEKLKEKADRIERVRKQIIEKSKAEEDYDIFICFKAMEVGDKRKRTYSYDLSRELFNYLTERGYKVFFSPETLLNISEQEFEPYIYKALSTSKVMLLLCSDNNEIESPWVKNEWDRFLDMHNGKGLIPICGNKFKPYMPADLPLELRKLNALEYGINLKNSIDKKIKSYFGQEKNIENVACLKKKDKEPKHFLKICPKCGLYFDGEECENCGFRTKKYFSSEKEFDTTVKKLNHYVNLCKRDEYDLAYKEYSKDNLILNLNMDDFFVYKMIRYILDEYKNKKHNKEFINYIKRNMPKNEYNENIKIMIETFLQLDLNNENELDVKKALDQCLLFEELDIYEFFNSKYNEGCTHFEMIKLYISLFEKRLGEYENDDKVKKVPNHVRNIVFQKIVMFADYLSKKTKKDNEVVKYLYTILIRWYKNFAKSFSQIQEFIIKIKLLGVRKKYNELDFSEYHVSVFSRLIIFSSIMLIGLLGVVVCVIGFFIPTTIYVNQYNKEYVYDQIFEYPEIIGETMFGIKKRLNEGNVFFSGYDNKQIGIQIITCTYKNKSCTFEICVKAIPLSIDTITINNGVIYFDNDLYCKGYTVTVNGNTFEIVNETFFDLYKNCVDESLEYNVEIVKNGIENISQTIKTTFLLTKLSTPKIEIKNGTISSLTDNQEVYIDGVLNSGDLSCLEAGTHEVYVKSKATSNKELDSNFSNTITINKLEAPNITIEEGKIKGLQDNQKIYIDGLLFNGDISAISAGDHTIEVVQEAINENEINSSKSTSVLFSKLDTPNINVVDGQLEGLQDDIAIFIDDEPFDKDITLLSAGLHSVCAVNFGKEDGQVDSNKSNTITINKLEAPNITIEEGKIKGIECNTIVYIDGALSNGDLSYLDAGNYTITAYNKAFNVNELNSNNCIIEYICNSIFDYKGYTLNYKNNEVKYSKDKNIVYIGSSFFLESEHNIAKNKFLIVAVNEGILVNNGSGVITIPSDFTESKIIIEIYNGTEKIFVKEYNVIEGKFSGGSGIFDDPYLISTCEDLQYLSNDATCWNSSFKLTKDLDFDGNEIVPIGNSSAYFSGIFDGQNYTITNIKIITPVDYSLSLFAFNSGCIQNVHINTIAIGQGDVEKSIPIKYAASIVGVNTGKIIHCFIDTITIDVRYEANNDFEICVGGLVAYSTKKDTDSSLIELCSVNNISYLGGICNCIDKDTIPADSGIKKCFIGGICGKTSGLSICNCLVNNINEIWCQAVGNSTQTYAGGVIGYAELDSCLSNCVIGEIKTLGTHYRNWIIIDDQEGSFIGSGLVSVTNSYILENSVLSPNVKEGVFIVEKLTLENCSALDVDVWQENLSNILELK